MSLDGSETLHWGHCALAVVLDVAATGVVGVRTLSGPATDPPSSPAWQPLVEVLLPGSGRAHASPRFSDTVIGNRLRYAGSASSRDGAWHVLRVRLTDEVSGLAVEVCLRSVDGVAAYQSTVTVTNEGTAPVTLLAVSSFAAGFAGHRVDDVDVVWADSEWLGESRWQRRPLREAGAPDLNLAAHRQDGRGLFALTSTGTWSTGRYLPTGGVLDRVSGAAWLWQIEHNGGWHWEVGERLS